MKVIIAGGRDLHDMRQVEKAVEDSGFEITEVVCGGATGVDALGARWAGERGIKVALFQADWAKHGKRAGPLRNLEMAQYADALIALPPGGPGTADMIRCAEMMQLQVHVHTGWMI